MKNIIAIVLTLIITTAAGAVDLKHGRIIVGAQDAALVKKMATLLSEDIERVTGEKPSIGMQATGEGPEVVLATAEHAAEMCPEAKAGELLGSWERYKITTRGKRLCIVGSDPRGLAYGVMHVSRKIGVNPWYWWADVPVEHKEKPDYKENYTSASPSVKYRGIFINDEDWGLKTWAARNFEKELNDIGPKTYDKVCELLLRLRANMLAPAMHSCTGALYSHPERQRRDGEEGGARSNDSCAATVTNN